MATVLPKLLFLKRAHRYFVLSKSPRRYYSLPFLEFYHKTTGLPTTENFLLNLKKKCPNIETLSHDRLECSIQILNKFGISPAEALNDPHVFVMNPITLDNYGEILKECGFIKIAPKHLIRYHTLVRSRTISQLKKQGLIKDDLKLEQLLLQAFQEWPEEQKSLQNFADSDTSILTVRVSVLHRYLKWKLCVSDDEFQKYCRNYLPLKHKPMLDIKDSLDLAQKEILFDIQEIRRNGFIISCDPVNTKLIIENVRSIAGLDIKEAIKIEPAILKNNYNSLLQIRDLLQEYRISDVAQKRCLRVYCMCPKTVKQRLEELKNLKEFQVLATNPRVLSMVVHKKKMMSRLNQIQTVKKQCFSLNHLVSSSKVFNNYINNFGEKVCGRDIAVLITTSLQNKLTEDKAVIHTLKTIKSRLKRHKYWLHVALQVIDENITFLKKYFDDTTILNNCYLLLYPVQEVELYIKYLLGTRRNEGSANEYKNFQLEANYTLLQYEKLTDDQILSLVLYEIEKKYHFSGDGIWSKCDIPKVDVQLSS